MSKWFQLSKAAPIVAMLGATAASIALGATSARAALSRGFEIPPRVHTAQVLKASDNAHLRYLSASGALLYEEGRATGALPGKMRAHIDVSAVFSGSFTIYAHGGSITGKGTAIPHGSGTYESFAGSLVVTGGSGRYAHAHGRAGLYGTFNRNTYDFVVQTTGTLVY